MHEKPDIDWKCNWMLEINFDQAQNFDKDKYALQLLQVSVGNIVILKVLGWEKSIKCK